MRHPNHRLVKIHRSYTVEEIAVLFSIHKNTVRQWIKQGLQVIDTKRPMLVQGMELSNFLKLRRAKNKRTCKPREIYCVKCREPRLPAEMEADYQCLTDTQGFLIGICPCCEILIYRRVSLAKLVLSRGELALTMPEGLKHLEGIDAPSPNSDFK